MARTKHFYRGCPWADGSPQCADTTQVYNWQEVTCGHCLKNRGINHESTYWHAGDVERYYATVEFLAKTNAPKTLVIGHDARVKLTREQLVMLGARVNVNRRQLRRREKTYLRIRGKGGNAWFFQVLLPTIRGLWPDAYMTSGGFWAEHEGDYQMDTVVALER